MNQTEPKLTAIPKLNIITGIIAAVWVLITLGLFAANRHERISAMNRIAANPELSKYSDDPNMMEALGATGVGTVSYLIISIAIGFAIILTVYALLKAIPKLKSILNKKIKLFPTNRRTPSGFVLLITLFLSASIFLWLNNPGFLVSFWTASGTLFFAYFAYLHTKEKFRLELLGEREKIYEAVHEFTRRLRALSLVHDNVMDRSFADMLDHAKKLIDTCSDLKKNINDVKLKRLYGTEVADYYGRLDNLFYQIHSDMTLIEMGLDDDDKSVQANLIQNMKDIVTLTKQLDEIFSPYLYFGHYKL